MGWGVVQNWHLAAESRWAGRTGDCTNGPPEGLGTAAEADAIASVGRAVPHGRIAGTCRKGARACATLPYGLGPTYFPRSLHAPLPTACACPMADTTLMDKLVSLCKRRGFVFQ